ncbi:MAG: hypothetical protein FWC33_06040 [Candidatus Bathyarchaeota archaeon]|nr:hypothetical protein [Candidatus Termiticorpusculum sp.]
MNKNFYIKVTEHQKGCTDKALELLLFELFEVEKISAFEITSENTHTHAQRTQTPQPIHPSTQ